MKTIKIEEDVHRLLTPHTTLGGIKRTFSDVVKQFATPTPYSNFSPIKFDDVEGKVLIADYYLSEEEPNCENLSAELCIELDSKYSWEDTWKKIEGSSLLELGISIGKKWGTLSCGDFEADCHYGDGDNRFVIVSLFVDDYIKYFKEDKKN